MPRKQGDNACEAQHMTSSPKYVALSGRSVLDLRPDSHDEYESQDPYPKGESRDKAISEYVARIVLPMLPELRQKECTVLDAGCGTGDWLAEIVHQAKRTHVIDVAEYSPIALKKCLDRNSFVREATLFDANFFPYPENKYDVIVSINLFEHIAAPVVFLQKTLASLKNHGVLFISTPSRYRFGNMVRVALGKPGTLIHDLHVTEYTVGQVKEMTRFAGGQVTRTGGTAMVVKGQRMYFLSAILAFPLQWLCRAVGSHHLLHKTVYYRIEKQ